MHGEASAPLDVSHEGGAELRVVGQSGVVSRQAHQRGEAKPLLGRDVQPAVVSEHGVVPAELLGVCRGAAEHFHPPGRHVSSVRLRDTAREQRRQQLVALDPVVEGIDQTPERRLSPRPLEQRRHGFVWHAATLRPVQDTVI